MSPTFTNNNYNHEYNIFFSEKISYFIIFMLILLYLYTEYLIYIIDIYPDAFIHFIQSVCMGRPPLSPSWPLTEPQFHRKQRENPATAPRMRTVVHSGGFRARAVSRSLPRQRSRL